MKSSCNMSKVIWFSRLLVVVLVLSTLTVPSPADAQGSVVSLSGVGTATIDGQPAPGEWDLAGKVNFLVNLPLADGAGLRPAPCSSRSLPRWRPAALPFVVPRFRSCVLRSRGRQA